MKLEEIRKMIQHLRHHAAGYSMAADRYTPELLVRAADEMEKLLAVADAAKRLSGNVAEFDTVTDNCFLERIDAALDALEAMS